MQYVFLFRFFIPLFSSVFYSLKFVSPRYLSSPLASPFCFLLPRLSHLIAPYLPQSSSLHASLFPPFPLLSCPSLPFLPLAVLPSFIVPLKSR